MGAVVKLPIHHTPRAIVGASSSLPCTSHGGEVTLRGTVGTHWADLIEITLPDGSSVTVEADYFAIAVSEVLR